MVNAGKVLLKVVVNRLRDSCKREDILPEKQYGIGRQRSTIDMIFVARGIHLLARKERTLF